MICVVDVAVIVVGFVADRCGGGVVATVVYVVVDALVIVWCYCCYCWWRWRCY